MLHGPALMLVCPLWELSVLSVMVTQQAMMLHVIWFISITATIHFFSNPILPASNISNFNNWLFTSRVLDFDAIEFLAWVTACYDHENN